MINKEKTPHRWTHERYFSYHRYKQYTCDMWYCEDCGASLRQSETDFKNLLDSMDCSRITRRCSKPGHYVKFIYPNSLKEDATIAECISVKGVYNTASFHLERGATILETSEAIANAI